MTFRPRLCALLPLVAASTIALSPFSDTQHQRSADFLEHEAFVATDPAGFASLVAAADRYKGPPGEALQAAWGAKSDKNRLLLLLCATFKYRDVLMNFIWVLETRFGIDNYGVACMDAQVADWFESLGKECFRMVDRSDPTARPRPRMMLMYHLLVEGVHVLHNDVDAVWGSNNLAILQTADIVGQRDKHPKQQLGKWGATFCTGSLYLRSCPETQQILRSLFDNDASVHFFLDQLRFNMALDHHTGGITWDAAGTPPLDYGSSGSSKQPDFGTMKKLNGLRVAILPQDPYRRECTGNIWLMRSAKITHCNAPKQSESKRAMLERFERWELPADWDACIERSRPQPFFNLQCPAAQSQQSYKDRRKEWCLQLAEKMNLRPLQRGSAYEGPLFDAADPKLERSGPWGKLGARGMTDVYFTMGDGGCEALIGSMPAPPAFGVATERRLSMEGGGVGTVPLVRGHNASIVTGDSTPRLVR